MSPVKSKSGKESTEGMHIKLRHFREDTIRPGYEFAPMLFSASAILIHANPAPERLKSNTEGAEQAE